MNQPSKVFQQALLFEQLAGILFERYHCQGPSYLLNAVIELYQGHMAVAVLCNSQTVSSALVHLADVSLAKYQLYFDLHALQSSVTYYMEALNHGKPSESHRIDAEVGLAYALKHRFEALCCYEDRSRALHILDDIMKRIDQYNPKWPWALAVDIIVRNSSYELGDTAISPDVLRAMLQNLTSVRRTLLPMSQYLLSLAAEAVLCEDIFHMSMGEPQSQYIDAGLEAVEKALQICVSQAEVKHHYILSRKFILHVLRGSTIKNQDGYLLQLEKTVGIAESMIQAASESSNKYLQSHSLACWAYSKRQLALRREDLDGMECAVKALKQALSLCPPLHCSKLMLVNNLAGALGDYFLQSGRVSALDDVIALEVPQSHCVERARGFALNVAEAMLHRALLSDKGTALRLVDKAHSICQRRKAYLTETRTFVGTPPVGAEAELKAVDLSIIRASRMRLQSGNAPILNVSEFPPPNRQNFDNASHLYRVYDFVYHLLAYVDTLISHARVSKNEAPLQEAETLLKQELSRGHTQVFIFRIDLLAAQADVEVARFEIRVGDTERLSKAWDLFRKASSITELRAKERFQACLRWATHATRNGCASDAFEAYSRAIEILPQVISHGEDVTGRIAALRQINGLAASSITVALSVGDICAAIGFMEKTRGILWSQSFQSQSFDSHALPMDLKARFLSITRDLEAADRLSWTTRRRKAEEFDETLREIRALPGQERFLLPPALKEIEKILLTRQEYAVIIIPSRCFCDIVMLGGTCGHRHLRLDTTSTTRIEELEQQFGKICTNTREAQLEHCNSRAVKQVNSDTCESSKFSHSGAEILAELWSTLVNPIIKDLNIQKPASHNKPRKRLWWCPIGHLSSLPLHAAGIYEGSTPDYASQYGISSYTTTLSTLHRLLTGNLNIIEEYPRRSKMLLVAQPDAIGLPYLCNTTKEAEEVQTNVPRDSQLIDYFTVPVHLALSSVKSASVLHLACHGCQDQDNPLNSGFELQDGRLTLGDLMRVDTPHAQLAYLSACQSAGMDASRPDESLNLAGAMLFVGFKSVIATMWAMDDIDGPFMAKRIYQRIFRNGTLDMGAVPYALEDAARELRESGAPASRWATYIHMGV